MTQQCDPIDVKTLASEIDANIHSLPPNAKTEDVRAIRRKYTKHLAKAAPKEVVDLALCLLSEYGHRFVAYELIHHHDHALSSLRAKELKQFGQGMNSWDAVDTFASYLSGPAWRENQVSDTVIHQWARSKDRWWRRAALVSTVPLNIKARGGTGDVSRTLEVCQLLVDDHDDMIVKALSWALRALVQHDPKAVRTFLAEHDDILAARVKREVWNKLITGLKNPRKGRIR